MDFTGKFVLCSIPLELLLIGRDGGFCTLCIAAILFVRAGC